MNATYRDSDAGTNRATLTQYQILARATALGWNIELAEANGAAFLLFRAISWQGRQPRYVLTATDAAFLPALRDLAKVGTQRYRATVTLTTEEPIYVTGGMSAIPSHNAEKVRLWTELTAAN